MRNFITVVALFVSVCSNAQFKLTPNGFNKVSFEKPLKTNEKFIELAQSWAASYNRGNDYPYEIYNQTETSFDLDAYKLNAFYYRNRGVSFYHRIKYQMHVELLERTYTVSFNIKEIYTSNVLTEMTISTFFGSDGRLKQEYLDVQPSLEQSVNSIVNSFSDYMATY